MLDKSLLQAYRATLNHLIFNTPPIKTVETDHMRGLTIPAGCDSYSQIGTPQGQVSGNPMYALEEWKKVFEHYFPPVVSKKNKQLLDKWSVPYCGL